MGNADAASRVLLAAPVHPHVHGERGSDAVTVMYITGSSPRTWGTLLDIPRVRQCLRFIPTYMGNAALIKRELGREAVHPHVHGERRTVKREPSRANGSSPRTWGTRHRLMDNRLRLRFIPTYMGNALDVLGDYPVLQVHPHVHGERPCITIK